MNQLPQVLQNEIWEYVRGDRAYWKQIHSNIINEWFLAFRDHRPRNQLYLSKGLDFDRSFTTHPEIQRNTHVFLGHEEPLMMFLPDIHKETFDVIGGPNLPRRPWEKTKLHCFDDARAELLHEMRRSHTISPGSNINQ